MKKTLRIGMLVAVSALIMTHPAHALFVNGGFETGDTSGWTVAGDRSVVSTYTPQFNNTTSWTSEIPWYGNYSLLLGSPGVGNEWDNYHASSATQTGTVTQADIDDGAHLYFRWGALLEEPTNYTHPDYSQPYFSIAISKFNTTTSAWDSLYSADHRANQPGWTLVGTNSSGDAGNIYYGSALTDVDLSGLSVGDSLKIDLYVRDCGAGGHGGLVLLDGFGTTNPDQPVPEPATMLLLGTGLAGLAGVCRRKKA